MARKRLLVVAGGVLIAVTAAWTAREYFRGQRLSRSQFLSPELCDPIKEGMTRAEAEAILGGPPGDFRTESVVFIEVGGGDYGDGKGRREFWGGDEGQIEVSFDEAGLVRYARMRGYHPWFRPPTPFEQARAWLQRVWP
jgi:hypothetical protein